MLWVLVVQEKIELEEPAPNEVREVFENGEINWTKGVIIARGFGFIDPKKPRGQAKLLAERAAVVDARRNLLEIIKGVHITSETVVEEYMTTSDIIVQQVQGIVRGAKVVGRPKYYDDGRVEVKVMLKISDLAQKVTPVKKPKESQEGTPPPDTVKGIVIKTPEGMKTCLYPRVVDPKGNVLLELSDFPNASEMWGKAIKFVKGNIYKNTKGYIVIEAEKAKGCDIVVGEESSGIINKIKSWAPHILKVGKFIIDIVK